MITTLDLRPDVYRRAEQASAERGFTVPEFLNEVIEERLAPPTGSDSQHFDEEELAKQRAIFRKVMRENRNILHALAQ